jgi:gamma-glutamylputrescine oxidase
MDHAPSLWAETAHSVNVRHSLNEGIKKDVAVIGAGFSGLSTAYHLSEMGVSVAIVDQNRIGWGASGRNAGMLTTGYKKNSSKLVKETGFADTKELLYLAVECIDLVVDIIKKHNIDCSLEHSTSLKAAYKPSHFDKMKKEHEYMLKHFDYPTHLVDPEKLKEELNSPLYHGGIIDPHSWTFHPLNYAIGLADVIEKLGGDIYEETSVQSIQKVDSKFILKTEQGEIVADDIVIATNGYTGEITKKLAKSVIPIGSHIVATEPLPDEVAQHLIPNKRGCIDSKNFLYYFRLTPDQRMLFGGRVDFKAAAKGLENNELYQKLHSNMLEVFPTLKDFQVDYQWGGITAFTVDLMPHLGQTEEGAHFAIGYCGHGAAMSTLMGKVIAEKIVKSYNGTFKLEKFPLKRVPLHSQRVLLMNLVGLYYKLCDKVL